MGQIVADAASLLRPGTTRAQAEAWASMAVGAGTREADEPVRYAGEKAVQDLVAYARRRRTRQAAVLLAALELVLPDGDLDLTSDDWVEPSRADVAWATENPPVLQEVSVATDPFDDQRVTFLRYDDHVVLVQTSRALGETVHDIALLDPDATVMWDADRTAWPRRVTELAEGVRPLLRAAEHTGFLFPSVDSDGYHMFRVLLDARLRATGVDDGPEDQPLEDEQREALLDRFFTDVGLPDDDTTRELADLCMTFAEGWLPGGALAWSPDAVARFLLDWVPRKSFLDEDARRLLPSVTHAFVGWALVQRGLDRPVAAEAAATALELEQEYLAAYEETERSPAAVLAQRIEQAGIDVTDKSAVDAIVSAYNAEQLARRARGD